MTSKKNKTVTLILCILLGWLGVHRFYVGRIKTGILYLLTGGVLGVGWIYDIFEIIGNRFKDSDGAYIATGAVSSKPSYKKIAFWIVLIVFYVFVFSGSPSKSADKSTNHPDVSSDSSSAEKVESDNLPQEREAKEIEPSSDIDAEISSNTSSEEINNESKEESSKEESSKEESSKEESSKEESSEEESSKEESSEEESSKAIESKPESKVEYSEPQRQMSQYVFYGNMDSMCYHTKMCTAAEKISDENRFTYTVNAYSLYDAQQEAIRYFESQGYHLCGICAR